MQMNTKGKILTEGSFKDGLRIEMKWVVTGVTLYESTIKVQLNSLYAIDRDQKIRLACNEFAYKKTKNDCKLGDTFQKNGQFAIADTQIRRYKDRI